MSRALGFSDVDGLGFAALRGRLADRDDLAVLRAQELGPFIEYALLAAANILPKPDEAKWLRLGELSTLYGALRERREQWVCPETQHLGVFRLSASPPEDDAPWVAFRLAAQKAAVANGFPNTTAAQLVGAISELESNIYEHSGAARTGLVCFKASLEQFEFVVADWGAGVLATLKQSPEFAHLEDNGEALELTLKDGVSRFGRASGRGYGFHNLFVGLANLNGSLRFRSGDAAVTIEGKDPGKMPWARAEKVPIKGFFASVACRVL